MTRKITKFLIYSFILMIGLFVYKRYSDERNVADKIISKNNELSLENKNNLIKNLKYDVNFENGTTHNISAGLSEIIYVEGNETVHMQDVSAIIIYEKSLPLIIKSDKAVFDNTNYNTTFSKNIKITYINNTIQSEKLFLDFNNSVVQINDNIIYEGMNGKGTADNIKIDLKTKDIQIFMDKTNEKIKINSK